MPPVPDPRDVALAFHAHYRLGNGDRRDRLAKADLDWAWETVADLVEQGGAQLLGLLDCLLDVPGADRAYRAYVGAGPLQDSLSGAARDWGDVVAQRCRTSAAWRDAVAAVDVGDSERVGLSTLDPYLPGRS